MEVAKKILYTATSDVHLRTFHMPYLNWLRENGFEVHAAVEKRGGVELPMCQRVFYLPFKRAPYHPNNWVAFRQLKDIINSTQYDIIHCHTPAVSLLTRLAAAGARKKGTSVLYTAHGYHFFKGCSLMAWMTFYPVEKFLSRITDAIVLINKEDFILTMKAFHNERTYYIKGIGVDGSRFRPLSIDEKIAVRSSLGLSASDFVLLYVAEFIPRKNHAFLLGAIAVLRKRIPSLKVVLAGQGQLLEGMKTFCSKVGLTDCVMFLGWRDDVPSLAGIADVGVSTSKQEGLGLGLAEQMLCMVPIVASNDRGHREMVIHGQNGYLFEQGDQHQFLSYVLDLYGDKNRRLAFGEAAYQTANQFKIENSLKAMTDIYRNLAS